MARYTDEQVEAIYRLGMVRRRLLETDPFYASMLMSTKLGLDENCQTAYTDGKRIAFSPAFLAMLTDNEVRFVLKHEILHMVLLHCARGENKNNLLFNIACDIVVNSNIFNEECFISSITVSGEESMHKTPRGEEGYLYTAEEVYEMLEESAEQIVVSQSSDVNSNSGSNQASGDDGDANGKGSGGKGQGSASNGTIDDHSKWGNMTSEEKAEMMSRVAAAASMCAQQAGNLPLCVERILEEWIHPQTDWRELLQNLLSTTVNDYSFSPPDRRMCESNFFLPDFNEPDVEVLDVMFFVDTSGSMSEHEVTQMFSEVRGAVNQFKGKLRGWLGFFDAEVVDPIAFDSIETLEIIRPKGGGGTSFRAVFDYMQTHKEFKPKCIVILTDGYAEFPKTQSVCNVPVLWIINNSDVTPPWGLVSRVQSEEL